MAERLSPEGLKQMKRDGKKIAAAVVYDYQTARITERAGADLLSVGDSLGRNILGHDDVMDSLCASAIFDQRKPDLHLFLIVTLDIFIRKLH